MKWLELKIPPLLLTLVFAGLMAVVASAAPGLFFRAPWLVVLALLMLFPGCALVVGGLYEFRRHQTTIDPRTPQATSALVTSGIYRVTRNPMYLGFLFLLAALALIISNWLAFVFPPLFVAWMNRFQILPEEKALAECFGLPYTQYMTQVRRWL